jgi:hypothetical protein
MPGNLFEPNDMSAYILNWELAVDGAFIYRHETYQVHFGKEMM